MGLHKKYCTELRSIFIQHTDDCVPVASMSGPLTVSDQQITSSMDAVGYDAPNARLHPIKFNQTLGYWMPTYTNPQPYIQVVIFLFFVTVLGFEPGSIRF